MLTEDNMIANDPVVARLLARVNESWSELQQSVEGLTDAQLTQPGTMDQWSIRDVLAHITTWEGEALQHLPTIMAGGRPPRYVTYGGIDAFNAMITEQKRELSIAEIRRQMHETHRQLLDLIRSAPADQGRGAHLGRRGAA